VEKNYSQICTKRKLYVYILDMGKAKILVKKRKMDGNRTGRRQCVRPGTRYRHSAGTTWVRAWAGAAGDIPSPSPAKKKERII
jgi:hypothetical protein